MSTRLCLSFERTPQWFKNNKLLFHFDKTTCRVVSDLEYLIRRKFAIPSVCNLYLDGYLLPSQESIDLVRDGDNLRVENEDLCHTTDKNLEIDKSSSKKRNLSHVLNAKFPSSKFSKSSSVRSQPVCSSTESSRANHKQNMKYSLTSTRCSPPMAFSSQENDNVSLEEDSTAQCRKHKRKYTTSHTKTSSTKQRQQNSTHSKHTNKSTKQNHERTRSAAPSKLSITASSESSESSPESVESQSTDSSFKVESSSDTDKSSTEDSSGTETSSNEKSSDSEASETESPPPKSLKSFKNASETSAFSSTLESGYTCSGEAANSRKHTKKVSTDNVVSDKSNNVKTLSKRTLGKNSKEVDSSPSNSTSDQPKKAKASKSSLSRKQSLQQSNKVSLPSTETNSRNLSSMAEGTLLCKETAIPSVTTSFSSQNATQPTKISNAKHIYFDSDEDEYNVQQSMTTNADTQIVNHSSNDVSVVDNGVSNSTEQGIVETNMQSFSGCNGNASNDQLIHGKEKEREKILDFSALPPLCGPPRVGDRIAYKILEISASYTPEMSDYKEGVVLAYDSKTGEVLVELTPESLIKPLGDGNISNKFELISDDNDDDNVSSKPPQVLEKKVTVSWSSMVSPKLINS